MINGDKLIKDFFSDRELELLSKLNMKKTDTLNDTYNKLTNYLINKGYSTLKNIPKNDEDMEYLQIMEKLFDILPIY